MDKSKLDEDKKSDLFSEHFHSTLINCDATRRSMQCDEGLSRETQNCDGKMLSCGIMKGQLCLDEDALGFYRENNRMYQAAMLLDTYCRTQMFRECYMSNCDDEDDWQNWLNKPADDEFGCVNMCNGVCEQSEESVCPDLACKPAWTGEKNCQAPPEDLGCCQEEPVDCCCDDDSEDSSESVEGPCAEDSLLVTQKRAIAENVPPILRRGPPREENFIYQSPFRPNGTSPRRAHFMPPTNPVARSPPIVNRPINMTLPRTSGYPQQKRGTFVTTSRNEGPPGPPSRIWLSPAPNELLAQAVASKECCVACPTPKIEPNCCNERGPPSRQRDKVTFSNNLNRPNSPPRPASRRGPRRTL